MFELENDNNIFFDLLKEWDRFLIEVICFCFEFYECEKFVKYKEYKVVLYKMCFVKVGFFGDKVNGFDKVLLKRKVEELYKEIGKEWFILEFREILLVFW